MKKNLITMLLIAAVFNCSAQGNAGSKYDIRNELHYGLKAGLNVSNVYDSKTQSFSTDCKFGFSEGGFLSIPVGAYLGLQSELLFSQKGFHAAGKYVDSDYEVTRTTNFVEIPLFICFKPTEMLALMAGPQYSYLVKQTDAFSNDLTTILEKEDLENDNIQKNTFCFVGGFELSFDPLLISGRIGWDAGDNNGEGTATIPRFNNVWYQATIGLEF